MYHWIVQRVARWGVLQMVDGNTAVLSRMADDNVRFRFPGHSSFAADVRGKAAVEAWLSRFRELRPSYEVEDVLVAGPPWNTRVGVRIRDRIGDDYSNEGMHYMRMRWGKIVLDQLYLDTEAIAEWESRHPELTA